MTLNTIAVVLSTVTAGAALAGSIGPDLVMTDIEFFEIYDAGNRYEIGFRYDLMNAGDAPIDLAGVDADNDLDNVAVQTYLTADQAVTGPAFASGGTAIFDPSVLDPSEVYGGEFYANTFHTHTPGALQDYLWLVIDIEGTDESAFALRNNRIVVPVPVPCGPSDRAAPFGQLDLADVAWFTDRFLAGNPIADVAADGLLDLADIVAFVEGFFDGCGGIE